MFSGLVQEIGTVAQKKDRLISVVSEALAPKKGDSIAVNGVCLTMIRMSVKGKKKELFFEISEETMRKSTMSNLRPGSPVNLETALSLAQGLGGHLVQGHVDGTGRVQRVVPQGNMKTIWFRAPSEISCYLVPKGSVTVDGVSVTSAELNANDFSVALIPYTLEHTTLGRMREGDAVNLEADVIGKYVSKYMKLKER